MNNIGVDADDYSIISDASVVVPCWKLLSKMSGGQALELKELERSYEEVLDENCRVYVKFFKEVLENSDDGNRVLISPPALVLKQITEKAEEVEYHEENNNVKSKELGLKNGRYNVMANML